MHALMPIPSQLNRFIRLPSEGEADGAIRFIRLETVVGIFVSRLFPGYRVRSQGAFRVLRDSDSRGAGRSRGSRAPVRVGA